MPALRDLRHPARLWVCLFFGTLLTACGDDDGSFFAAPAAPAPDAYVMRPLVSDGTLSAAAVDPLLINPWGIVFAPGSRVFVANNATDATTLYSGDGGVEQPHSTSLPGGINGAAAPTGVVFNGTTDFVVSDGATSAPATFIVAGEGGMLIALAPAVSQATALVAYNDGSGRAAYTGLAHAAHQGAELLYATDFRNGKVDVFDGSFRKITPAGEFVDPELPAGYAPFGIQAVALNGETALFVTYAQRAPDSAVPVNGAGLGLVNIFDTGGMFVSHFVPAGAQLNAPWGVALAPDGFGALSNAVLIGNVGDGVINAFDPATGEVIDRIRSSAGQPIAVSGLRGIAFGNGAHNQPVTTLFFAAGVANGAGGLYGRIDLADGSGFGQDGPAFSSGGGRVPSDSTPPTVHVTVPGPNATASSIITIAATANDNVGVARVEFFAGPFLIGFATLPPFAIDWDTTSVANGTYALVARATDFAGNLSTSIPVSVQVSNVPRAPPR